MKALKTTFTLSLLLVLAGSLAQAAIIVDPDGVGATNVTTPPWSAATNVTIGSSADGTVLVDQSDTVVENVVTNNVYIANGSSSTGIATISGDGTTWTAGRSVNVGASGDGSLYVTDGASLAIGIDGDMAADNPNARFMIGVNNGSYGYMEVNSGGKVWNSYINYLGRFEGSVGEALVTGAGSEWHSEGAINVGSLGSGTLNVENGGKVTTASWFDVERGGVINVTGADSVADGGGCIWLAYSSGSTGTLNVSDGGLAKAEFVQVGRGGPGSALNLDNGNLEVGSLLADPDDIHGTGVINANGLCTDIALVFDSQASKTQTIAGYGADSGVTINLEANENATRIGAGYAGVGSMSISNGVVITGVNGYLGYKASANGSATVTGADSAWLISDYLIVGVDGKGTLDISDGGLVSAGAAAFIDSDTGDTASSAINMSTGGMLAINGNGTGDDLSGSISAFLGAIGGDGMINWWNESISDWAALDTATLGTDCTLEYLTTGDLAGYTQLTVGTARVAGDANSDGKVDGSDVTILAGNWQAGVVGGGATWDMGDFNGDGKVDGSDVTILAGNWQYGVSAAASAVPEPGTLVLLLTALLTIGLVRKVKK